MSEFPPVKTKHELALLDDDDEMIEGYLSGYNGDPEPGSDKSRSFWHGWRNGRTDSGLSDVDMAQRQLAREIVGSYKGLH